LKGITVNTEELKTHRRLQEGMERILDVQEVRGIDVSSSVCVGACMQRELGT